MQCLLRVYSNKARTMVEARNCVHGRFGAAAAARKAARYANDAAQDAALAVVRLEIAPWFVQLEGNTNTLNVDSNSSGGTSTTSDMAKNA